MESKMSQTFETFVPTLKQQKLLHWPWSKCADFPSSLFCSADDRPTPTPCDYPTWSLTDTISRFIIPRLKRFKEVNNGVPHGQTEESWDITLDKMILSFELTCRDSGSRDYTDEERVQLNEGLDLFRKYFFELWWWFN